MVYRADTAMPITALTKARGTTQAATARQQLPRNRCELRICPFCTDNRQADRRAIDGCPGQTYLRVTGQAKLLPFGSFTAIAGNCQSCPKACTTCEGERSVAASAASS